MKTEEVKVNELRIGNYCAIEDKESRIIHVQEHYQWVQLEGNALMTNIHFVKPIPLTEEWWFKLGAKPNITGVPCLNLMEIGQVGWDKDRNIMMVLTPDGWDDSSIQPKFVHRLQNLYFALNDEELTYTL